MASGSNFLQAFLPRDLKVWHKLSVITGILGLASFILAYLTMSQYGVLIERDRGELAGVIHGRPILKLLQSVAQHRDLVNNVLNKDNSYADAATKEEEKVKKAFDDYNTVVNKYGDQFKKNADLTAVRGKWDAALKIADNTVEKNRAAHDEILADTKNILDGIGVDSRLVLDEYFDTYFQQNTLLDRLPNLLDIAAQIRGVGQTRVATKTVAFADKAQLFTLRGQFILLRSKVDGDIKEAGNKDSALKGTIEVENKAANDTANKFVELLDAELLQEGKNPSVATDVWWKSASTAIEAYEKLSDTIATTLAASVEKRVARGSTNYAFVLTGIIIALSLAGVLVFVVSNGITRQTEAIMNVFSSISIGQFEARAKVVTADDLGEMASSLNAMLDNTLALLQTADERDQLQQSITKLLEEVSGVGDGDLTHEAEVTADAMGAIADAFNYTIVQLREIIGNVQDASLQVSTSANEIQATADTLADGSRTQAEQIVNTSAALDEMAVSISQVSENAGLSSQVAQQSLSSAKKGNDAVRNTIAGMNRIRDQVQETAKRIKRLGESTQEIGQITQLIDDIADRTSILALNASIQAAMAGEAGRGFAVVAEEVERLAVRSTEATKKIGMLVKGIQSETNEAVSAMDKGIEEVVEGSKLANQAGQALDDIQRVSDKLAELISTITLASKQQSRGADALSKAMSEISQITQETASGTKQAAESVGQLAHLVDGLKGSVSKFRLPGRAISNGDVRLPNNRLGDVKSRR